MRAGTPSASPRRRARACVGDARRQSRRRAARRAAIDSRAASAAASCSSGCAGERADGGEHAAEALRAGAWGVLVSPEHAERRAQPRRRRDGRARVLAHPDPLAGLQALARAWRRELGASGAKVVGDHRLDRQDLDEGHPRGAARRTQRRVAGSPENLNTEIGLPLAMLAAPRGHARCWCSRWRCAAPGRSPS